MTNTNGTVLIYLKRFEMEAGPYEDIGLCVEGIPVHPLTLLHCMNEKITLDEINNVNNTQLKAALFRMYRHNQGA